MLPFRGYAIELTEASSDDYDDDGDSDGDGDGVRDGNGNGDGDDDGEDDGLCGDEDCRTRIRYLV